MTNNGVGKFGGRSLVVNRFQKMYLCYDEQQKKNIQFGRLVVNRFQKMYLCYDEQLHTNATAIR